MSATLNFRFKPGDIIVTNKPGYIPRQYITGYRDDQYLTYTDTDPISYRRNADSIHKYYHLDECYIIDAVLNKYKNE